MLRHLYIQNYALISHLDIDIEQGLSVLTGETGAGKSIILGALALVMGAKADTKAITDGEERCVIEAEFDHPIPTHTPTTILVRRELNRNGRSRSFVDDEIVTQQQLRTLAKQLLDIHSQHENLLLTEAEFQLNIVDTLANNLHERNQYFAAYTANRQANEQLIALKQQAERTRRDEDYISFQLQQLSNAHLTAGEKEQLEEEEYMLTHAEEIRNQLQHTLLCLDNDENNAISLIHNAQNSSICAIDQRLHSVEIELRDIRSEVEHALNNVDIDPQRLEWVQQRLVDIDNLLRKHHKDTIEELLELQNTWEKQLQQIASFDEDIQALQQQVDNTYSLLVDAARQLTTTREKVRLPMAAHLEKELGSLGIAHAKVDLAIHPLTEYNETGGDEVQLLFAANLNQKLRPVSEVASGGEISRLMLCLKSMVASYNQLPTILFDEIDTGISGEIATQMGKILRKMAQHRQVIVITHLPQIAAIGQTHYKVYKQDTDTRTETDIQRLTPSERIYEIATMLSGNQPSQAALANAEQLMNDNG